MQALRKDNVQVVLIHPGPVATDMTKVSKRYADSLVVAKFKAQRATFDACRTPAHACLADCEV